MNITLEHLRGGLAVSCRAGDDSLLQPTEHVVALARVAVIGSANAVRIEAVKNVAAVREAVAVPVIGITKIAQQGTDVYITPSLGNLRKRCQAGADMVAFDATKFPRPSSVPDLIAEIHRAGRIAMANISDLETQRKQWMRARILWGPRFPATRRTSRRAGRPILFSCARFHPRGSLSFRGARTWEPAEARLTIGYGAMFVVVGSAITRPDAITRRFADAVAGLAA